MAFVVVYDACVLFPAPLRDLLVRLARTGFVRARWSATILDECFRNVLKQRPDLDATALERARALMKEAVPDCIVSGFEPLIDGLRDQGLVRSVAKLRELLGGSAAIG